VATTLAHAAAGGLRYRRRNAASRAGVPKLHMLSATLIVTRGADRGVVGGERDGHLDEGDPGLIGERPRRGTDARRAATRAELVNG